MKNEKSKVALTPQTALSRRERITAKPLLTNIFKLSQKQRLGVQVFLRMTERNLKYSSIEYAIHMRKVTQQSVKHPSILPAEAHRFVKNLLKRADKHKIDESLPAEVYSMFKERALAASLIFAHSILDGIVMDLCKIYRTASPQEWLENVKDRKISLGEANGKGFEELVTPALDLYLDQLSRESLIKKIDVLYSKCKPAPGWTSIPGYVFDRARIERLDKNRQDIVHRYQTDSKLSDRDVYYLLYTVTHLVLLVAHKYGVKLSEYPIDMHSARLILSDTSVQ